MTLRLERDGAIGRILIDRPDKRNAMTLSMWALLPELLNAAHADAQIRVIILQSATPGIFCAGADIGELMANHANADWMAENQRLLNQAQYELARAPKPVIAAIDGDAVGGGCGLTLACDIRVATSRSRLGITPAKLGLVYPLHDTKLLVDLVGPGQAKRMLFTSGLYPAAEAQRIGLVDMLDADPDALALEIAEKSPHSTQAAKAMIRRILDGQTHDDADTLAIFSAAFQGADFAEGTAAFAEKRKPEFK
jgi:enoyl-CoA hydratase/carnithine racemase